MQTSRRPGKNVLRFGGLLSLALLTFQGPLQAAEKEAAAAKKEVPTKTESALISISGEVTAIDLEKRELTLVGPLGNETTLEVDKSVKGLDKVVVGDTLWVDYYAVAKAEIREPTEAEKAQPLAILETSDIGKDVPFDADVKIYKAVVTVEGIDRPTSTVTVKGPRGRYVTIPVKEAKNLEKLKLGQTIVITYADAVAVSFEKATTKK